MAKYLVKLTSGQTIHIEDARALKDLASGLCQDGFIQVARLTTGYQLDNEALIALFERAVISVELA